MMCERGVLQREKDNMLFLNDGVLHQGRESEGRAREGGRAVGCGACKSSLHCDHPAGNRDVHTRMRVVCMV